MSAAMVRCLCHSNSAFTCRLVDQLVQKLLAYLVIRSYIPREILRDKIKLIQSTKLPYSYFAYCLNDAVLTCSSDPPRKMT